MATIELRNVHKRYADGGVAVVGVDLAVADGEFLVVVGASGSGKSALLRMIAGTETITGGDLLIDGYRANALPPEQRNVAVISQEFGLARHLTVYENIAFPLRIYKFSKREIDFKVQEAARVLGLQDVLKAKPPKLSGGQQQRVAVGRALVRDPKILLFDEPLANLETSLRSQVRRDLAWLQQLLGVTTVYVTHDQQEAAALGDRVAVLDRGVVQQIGTPREIWAQPANMSVAGFIGPPPMSFLPVRIEGREAVLPFGRLRLPDSKVARVQGRPTLVAGVRAEYVDSARLGRENRYLLVPDPDAEVEINRLESELVGGSLRTQLLAHADSVSRVVQGARADLYIDSETLHLFDPNTGENLTRGL